MFRERVCDFEQIESVCSICQKTVKLTKCRVRAKRKGSLTCNVCGSRCTSLYRTYGTWPTEEFNQMDPQDQVTFMAEIGALQNIKQIKAKAEMLFNRFCKLEDSFSEGGAFLPLKV